MLFLMLFQMLLSFAFPFFLDNFAQLNRKEQKTI